jgi:hypothetical protein
MRIGIRAQFREISISRSKTTRSFATMSSSIDSILPHLLERPLPPLEPGKTVYAPELAKQIMGLEEHDFVKACTRDLIIDRYELIVLIGQRYI